jgi:hypothetical protein
MKDAGERVEGNLTSIRTRLAKLRLAKLRYFECSGCVHFLDWFGNKQELIIHYKYFV